MSEISCSNNRLSLSKKGTRHACFRKGIGVGINQPIESSYRDKYEPLDKRKIYCGKSAKLPSGYSIMGNLPMCLQKGVGVGKTIKAKRLESRSRARKRMKSRVRKSVRKTRRRVKTPSRRRVVRKTRRRIKSPSRSKTYSKQSRMDQYLTSSGRGLNPNAAEFNPDGGVELSSISDKRIYNITVRDLAGRIIARNSYPSSMSINELRENIVDNNSSNISDYVVRNGVLIYDGREISNPQRTLSNWANRYGFGTELEFVLSPSRWEIATQLINNFIQENLGQFRTNAMNEFRINRTVRVMPRWQAFCNYMFFLVTTQDGGIVAQWNFPGDHDDLPLFADSIANFLGTSLEELRGEGGLSEDALYHTRRMYQKFVQRLCKHSRYRNMIASNLTTNMRYIVPEHMVEGMPEGALQMVMWWNRGLGQGYWP